MSKIEDIDFYLSVALIVGVIDKYSIEYTIAWAVFLFILFMRILVALQKNRFKK